MNQLKFHWDNNSQDRDTAWLHVNVQLSNETIVRSVGDDQQVLGADLHHLLLKIYGVQSVWLERYKLRIERTKVVTWSSICSQVESTIFEYCQTNGIVPPEAEAKVES